MLGVMDAGEIAQYLARNAEAVAHMLLPNGKRISREWVAGSVYGEKGTSLSICLEGKKAGVWKDFASDEGGDLIDLWGLVKGLKLGPALEDIRNHYGLKAPEFEQFARRQYAKPERPKCHVPTGTALDWLTKVRKLSSETIKRYKVAEKDGVIIFPCKRGDDLVALKYRAVAEKKVWASKDTEPCLFGWQAIPEDCREIIITEGEIDAMSLYEYGLPALSVPFGAKNLQWIDTEYPHLDRFSDIVICFDNDKAGQEAISQIVNRLGLHRCRVMTLPGKDANECLQKDISASVVIESYTNASYIQPEGLHVPIKYLDDVIRYFHPEIEKQQPSLPWKQAQNKIALRDGELSIWTGVNGHGKSQVLGHTVLGLASQGIRICIASFEMKPRVLLARMVRQILGVGSPSALDIERALDWLCDKVWIYDFLGTSDPDSILDVFKYAKRRYNVNQFVIDSLMKCGMGEDDYRAQKFFVDKLSDFKHEFDCHVHLVAHARKGESEEKVAGKLDVKGTGAITDLADNVFSIWRNKKKEDTVEWASKNNKDVSPETLIEPDSVLYCSKQRNGEWEGKLQLWFDKKSFQYLDSGNDRVEPYLAPTGLSHGLK